MAIGLGLAVACARPTDHTPPPYAGGTPEGAALTARAEAFCRAAGRNDGIPPARPFVTDGCSRFPDRSWNTSCCVEHDIEYWCGGSAKDRLRADDVFGACVADRSNAFLGGLMRLGVRFGGHPIWPTTYRWGYGHRYRFGYPSAVRPD